MCDACIIPLNGASMRCRESMPGIVKSGCPLSHSRNATLGTPLDLSECFRNCDRGWYPLAEQLIDEQPTGIRLPSILLATHNNCSRFPHQPLHESLHDSSAEQETEDCKIGLGVLARPRSSIFPKEETTAIWSHRSRRRWRQKRCGLVVVGVLLDGAETVCRAVSFVR